MALENQSFETYIVQKLQRYKKWTKVLGLKMKGPGPKAFHVLSKAMFKLSKDMQKYTHKFNGLKD